jgi:hypothetical protein
MTQAALTGYAMPPVMPADCDLLAYVKEARRVERRRERYRLHRWCQEFSELKGVKRCGLPIAGEVTIACSKLENGVVARVTGIGRCGSPWACPVCAPVVRERRAREIDEACAEALKRGWTIMFVSSTLPHTADDTLKKTFGLLRYGHQATRSGRPWRCIRDGFGFEGSIRAWEMPHGGNGWHPHAHELVFFSGGRCKADLKAGLHRHYMQTYGQRVEYLTGRPLHPVHGVDVREVTSSAALSAYLAKVEGGWGAGLEVARGDIKATRGGRTPWQLLEAAGQGEVDALALWSEYEKVTYGKRAIMWSRGLRSKLALEEEEISDEEAAAGQDEGEEIWTMTLPADRWCAIRRAGSVAYLLEHCELAAKGGDP